MRVVTVGPTPPEAQAYALARYSRSADTIEDSLGWVKEHDSAKFFETYYFKYGHPSIADLGHLAMSLEGISNVASIEVEDEPLWDGQERSTRYQDFSKCEPVIPPCMNQRETEAYLDTFGVLLSAYREVRDKVRDNLARETPRPADMKVDAYDRAIDAKAFDVARYLLPMGISTSVGQVVSIRTLEKQIRRLLASPYGEVRQLGEKMKTACTEPPSAIFDVESAKPIAPTLAKYLEPDQFRKDLKDELVYWYGQVTKGRWKAEESHEKANGAKLYSLGQELWSTRVLSPTADSLATLLYPYIDSSYEDLLSFVCSLYRREIERAFWGVSNVRGQHDELPRAFRNQPYIFELTTDIGAYRDLHRHRRCQQFPQKYGTLHGYEIPEAVIKAGILNTYVGAMDRAHETFRILSPGSYAAYILPFGTRIRALFKMDFAEAEYICKLRSKVGGHFSYRRLVCQMADLMKKQEPYLGRLMEVTDPTVEAPLCR